MPFSGVPGAACRPRTGSPAGTPAGAPCLSAGRRIRILHMFPHRSGRAARSPWSSRSWAFRVRASSCSRSKALVPASASSSPASLSRAVETFGDVVRRPWRCPRAGLSASASSSARTCVEFRGGPGLLPRPYRKPGGVRPRSCRHAASLRGGKASPEDNSRCYAWHMGFSYPEPVQGFEPLPAQVDLPALEHEMLARWRDARHLRAVTEADGGRASRGSSTRGRRPPTACRACTTSRRACSRTCSPGSRPCRASTSRARAAGTATGCRSRSRSRRSSASPASRTSRRTASRSSTRAAASRCCGTSTRGPALTERMGYWIDLTHAYRTMDPSYIESVWWSLKQIYDAGAAGPGLPDQPVLPALRDAAVRPRDGPAGRLPDGVRPGGHGQVPAADACPTGAPRARGRRPAGVDDDAVDAGRPTPRWRCTRTRPTWSRAGPATATGWWSPTTCSRRVLGEGWHVAARFTRRGAGRARPTRPPFGLDRRSRTRTSSFPGHS